MRTNLAPLRTGLASLICLLIYNISAAQNCTVNAGIPAQYCNVTSFTLTGKDGGQVGTPSNVLWTQVGGSPTLTITNPASLVTTVTGVVPGVFVFRISLDCQ